MSIYDKASLVLIPSGTKTSKVYSQKPTSGDGDFTFSRSTAATRVNADGVIEKETQNLLLQSNSFDTTWVNFNTSDTGGQSGYDGSSNAWLISNTGASGHIRQTSISASGIQTFSIYAKAGSLNWLKVTSQSGNVKFNVNLSNGTIGTTGNLVIEAKATDIGSGWYRCSMAFNASTTGVYIYPATADEDVSQTSGNIYIQDAQLEQGLVARDVITTTTSAVEGGITDNVPRLDYTDSSCPALLLEPQRTNLIAQSEYFGAKWTLIQSVKSDGVLSPSGELTAVTITDDGLGGSSSNVRIQADNFTISASTKYTFSAYVKANPNTIIKVTTRNDDALRGGTFNISTLTFTAEQGTETGNVKDFGNGFYRISTTWTSGSDTSIGIGIGFPNVTRDGTNSFTLWGAQCEAGSYASSYIPSYGSAVSRSADVCKDAGNSDVFESEGVLYAEFQDNFLKEGSYRLISINNAASNSANSVTIGFKNNGNLYFRVKSPSGTYTNQTIDANLNEFYKVALKYKSGDIAIWINGVEVDTNTTAFSFAAILDNLSFDFNGNGVLPFYGKTKMVAVFPYLSNEELATLTTL